MNSFEDTAKEKWQREGYTQALEDVMATLGHSSDCGVHNEPAYPNSGCDCGLLLNRKERHNIVMGSYDADPIDCADGAVETACIEQFKRITSKLLALAFPA